MSGCAMITEEWARFDDGDTHTGRAIGIFSLEKTQLNAMSTHGLNFRARGMHCPGCEHIIEELVRQLPGVQRVKADYPTETVAVVFDPALTRISRTSARRSRERVTAADRRMMPKLRAMASGSSPVLVLAIPVSFSSFFSIPNGLARAGHPMSASTWAMASFWCLVF